MEHLKLKLREGRLEDLHEAVTAPKRGASRAALCLADGLKVGKEGRRMPAVKKLHQASSNNSKPPFIFGHSFQAVSLLVRTTDGHAAAVPMAARIHEGVVWSDRDRRSLLDRLVALFMPLAVTLDAPVILVADAYYASRKVIVPLLEGGHQLVTRVRKSTVPYRIPPPVRTRRRGRPRIYGSHVRVRDLFDDSGKFESAPSPVYSERNVAISYRSFDLVWRPVGRSVRFVLVRHPVRGSIVLLSTDLTLDPLDVITLYAYRYKIEPGFRQALHVVGSYSCHFWMAAMTPLRRKSGDQYMHRKSQDYRDRVRRKLDAYHRHVQPGCIAQGLLQYLAITCSDTVWRLFRSWLRTMNPDQPPSELVVACALRSSLAEFLDAKLADPVLAKFLRQRIFARHRTTAHARAA